MLENLMYVVGATKQNISLKFLIVPDSFLLVPGVEERREEVYLKL
jgi:hypothetical protein